MQSSDGTHSWWFVSTPSLTASMPEAILSTRFASKHMFFVLASGAYNTNEAHDTCHFLRKAVPRSISNARLVYARHSPCQYYL